MPVCLCPESESLSSISLSAQRMCVLEPACSSDINEVPPHADKHRMGLSLLDQKFSQKDRARVRKAPKSANAMSK